MESGENGRAKLNSEMQPLQLLSFKDRQGMVGYNLHNEGPSSNLGAGYFALGCGSQPVDASLAMSGRLYADTNSNTNNNSSTSDNNNNNTDSTLVAAQQESNANQGQDPNKKQPAKRASTKDRHTKVDGRGDESECRRRVRRGFSS